MFCPLVHGDGAKPREPKASHRSTLFRTVDTLVVSIEVSSQDLNQLFLHRCSFVIWGW
jgi:hypothetical protein